MGQYVYVRGTHPDVEVLTRDLVLAPASGGQRIPSPSLAASLDRAHRRAPGPAAAPRLSRRPGAFAPACRPTRREPACRRRLTATRTLDGSPCESQRNTCREHDDRFGSLRAPGPGIPESVRDLGARARPLAKERRSSVRVNAKGRTPYLRAAAVVWLAGHMQDAALACEHPPPVPDRTRPDPAKVMSFNLRNRSLLTVQDYTPREFRHLLDLARDLNGPSTLARNKSTSKARRSV